MFKTIFIFLAGFTLVTPYFYQGFHFEYHASHHLLLVTTATKCYVITVNSKTATAWTAQRQKVMDELIERIHSGTGLTPRDDSLLHRYHDYLAVVECLRHEVVSVHYSFGEAVTTTAATTTPAVTQPVQGV
ncbi:uncharacterized protein LOC121389613 [Gigantopelta aegis]|uniref:uncharacterized protein LOC121389613 n=1 Tax=Gigantopelta aegis TaxID=1735272 RepID=UPI001B8893DC|nr:uncharacterized protein LOC121389613 [Gigantopelta aegis]